MLRSGQALTEADLTWVERKLKRELPAELRAHYATANGGKPQRDVYRGEDDDYRVHAFKTMRHPRFEGELLFEDTDLNIIQKKRLLPATYFAFATDEGGNFFCVDALDGAVRFCPMDGTDPFPCIGKRLARSLGEFFGALTRG